MIYIFAISHSVSALNQYQASIFGIKREYLNKNRERMENKHYYVQI